MYVFIHSTSQDSGTETEDDGTKITTFQLSYFAVPSTLQVSHHFGLIGLSTNSTDRAKRSGQVIPVTCALPAQYFLAYLSEFSAAARFLVSSRRTNSRPPDTGTFTQQTLMGG